MTPSKQDIFTEINETDCENLAGGNGVGLWFGGSGGGGATFGLTSKYFSFVKTLNYMYSYGRMAT